MGQKNSKQKSKKIINENSNHLISQHLNKNDNSLIQKPIQKNTPQPKLNFNAECVNPQHLKHNDAPFVSEAIISKCQLNSNICDVNEAGDEILLKLTKFKNSEVFRDVRNRLKKKNYVITDYIASGGQAEVFKGYSFTHKTECAIRISGNTPEDYKSLEKEHDIVKHIKLPLNVIRLYDVEFFQDIQIAVHILELCECSLQDEIKQHQDNQTWFTKDEQQFIILSLCDALSEIHSYEIIHFDIKPLNILKTKKGEYVLSDFGNSKKLQKMQTEVNKFYGFSVIYLSPEQRQNLEEQRNNQKVVTSVSYSTDIYSLGLVFLLILGFPINLSFSINLRLQLKLIFNTNEEKNLFDIVKEKLFDLDPSKRLKSFELPLLLIKVFGEMSDTLKETVLKKISFILDQDKYENAKNIHTLTSLIHNYSLLYYELSSSLESEQFNQLKSKSRDYVAQSYFRQGNYQMALQYFEEQLNLKKILFSDNHLDIAQSLNNIAVCFKKLGKANEALQYHQDSLKIKKSLFFGNHPDIAASLHKIAVCYKRLGKANEALKYNQESLEMRKSLFSGNNPDTANSLNNIAACFLELGKSDEALKYFQESLEMHRSLFSGNHPQIANSLNNLALCFWSLGKEDEALQYNQESLKMRKSLFSGNHPDIAKSLNNLAGCLRQLGKSDEALKYFEESLEIRKSLYSGNHHQIANSLNNIAVCLWQLGQAEEALNKFQESLEMRRLLFSGNHPQIMISLKSIARCYDSFDKPEKALIYYRELLEIQKSLSSPRRCYAKTLKKITQCEIKLRIAE